MPNNKRVGVERIAAHIVKVQGRKGNTVTRKQAVEMVDMVAEAMFLALINGYTVSISNFISLTPIVRQERSARNPQNGETVHVPARKWVKLRLQDHLVAVLNGESTRFTLKKGPGGQHSKAKQPEQ